MKYYRALFGTVFFTIWYSFGSDSCSIWITQNATNTQLSFTWEIWRCVREWLQGATFIMFSWSALSRNDYSVYYLLATHYVVMLYNPIFYHQLIMLSWHTALCIWLFIWFSYRVLQAMIIVAFRLYCWRTIKSGKSRTESCGILRIQCGRGITTTSHVIFVFANNEGCIISFCHAMFEQWLLQSSRSSALCLWWLPLFYKYNWCVALIRMHDIIYHMQSDVIWFSTLEKIIR